MPECQCLDCLERREGRPKAEMWQRLLREAFVMDAKGKEAARGC